MNNIIKNTYNVKRGKLPIKRRFGSIDECFFINKKEKPPINDIYLVLRPDKDEKAAILFPNKKVIYLRYDNENDLLLIKKYYSLN